MTPDLAADNHWMRRALRLAARGMAAPNPMVGCVLVRDGMVVGEGWHRYAGAPHAEAEALACAGEAARGATAYVSLEPCAHFGRTPPCADALVSAGIVRVVAASMDPDPRVAGRGAAILRQAGLTVELGLMASAAVELNHAFMHFHRVGRPHVTLKAAVTLDGRIATRLGDSRWVTGDAARRHVHHVRARVSAVLCGVGTVLADDPTLNARVRGAVNQPVRVVLDPSLRTPPSSMLIESARDQPTLLVAGPRAPSDAEARLVDCGAEVVRLECGRDGFGLQGVMQVLARRGIISVLVEGGGITLAHFLDAGLADRLLWYVAAKVLGGGRARPSVAGRDPVYMAEAHAFRFVRRQRLAEDILLVAEPRALAEESVGASVWADRREDNNG